MGVAELGTSGFVSHEVVDKLPVRTETTAVLGGGCRILFTAHSRSNCRTPRKGFPQLTHAAPGRLHPLAHHVGLLRRLPACLHD